MNLEKTRKILKSYAEQLDKVKAPMPTSEDYEEQMSLSNDYIKSSDKEGFLKSRKGQRFVTLTCLVGNCDVTEALKWIREHDGIFDPAYLGAYD
jgi:hypothetical protein